MKKKNLDGSDLLLSSNIFNVKDQILVSFYNINEVLIYEDQYSSEKMISGVIDDFIEKNSEKILQKYLNTNKYFNKRYLSFYIKKNYKFEKIEEKNKMIISYIYDINDTIMLLGVGYQISSSTGITNSKLLRIYVQYEFKYKYLSDNMEEYINNYTFLIGKPMLNNLKYYLYNKHRKNLKLIKYNKEDINKYKLNSFSSIDAYCNAKNYLYIYESISKYDYKDSNKFISINLINNNINLISSNFPKRILHSMIYIPERYIFIIGGENEKEVLIYEIKEENINYEKYPYLLPYIILEPSLIYVNNKYLYAFENSKLDFHILRINLISISPFIDIKLENKKNITINQKFFGVVKNENSILFLGCQMINLNNEFNNKCYEFHYNSNKLYISKREFKSFNFIEKTFIPLGGDIYMQISEHKKLNKYKPKIILFDGSSQEVEKSEKDT